MVSRILNSVALLSAVFCVSAAEASVDSYRYAHVTIATPWYIFLFLMLGIFLPFILMAVLAWRVAMRKSEQAASGEADQKSSNK